MCKACSHGVGRPWHLDNHGFTGQGRVQAGAQAALVLPFVEMHRQLTGEDNRLRLVPVNQGHRYFIGVGDGVAGQRSNPSKGFVQRPLAEHDLAQLSERSQRLEIATISGLAFSGTHT
jgi:hypothetical protein